MGAEYVGDDSEEVENESSGNSDLVGLSGNMSEPSNLTTITANNREVGVTDPAENPLEIPMTIVGGIVGLIILITLLCFVYRRHRRPPARVSERRSKGRSLVSDELRTSQNLLDGPLGFSQSVYGLEDDVDRTIAITEITGYSDSANGMTPVNSDIQPENESQKQPLYENHVNNVSKSRTSGNLPDIKTKTDRHDPASLSCSDVRQNVFEGKFSFGTSDSDSLKVDCCSSSAISDKQGQVSEEKRKSQTHLNQTASISKDLCDSDIIVKDNTSNIPPPSPCNIETIRDYVNVPKGTAERAEAKAEKDSQHSYVNISDETEGRPIYNKLNKFDKEYKNISGSEVKDKTRKEYESGLCEVDNEDSNKEYVNVAGKLNKPPSYDEATASDEEGEAMQDSKCSKNVNKSEYENVPKQQPKVEKNFSKKNKTSPFVKLNLPNKCGGYKHTCFSESDTYLPMDYAAEQEDEYVPVGSPGSFMSYERSTFSRPSPSKMLISGAKSEDALHFGSYVNTRGSVMSRRSGSCDSVYSYADPDIMCSLHFSADDLVQSNKRTKSRLANRSKTFSTADSRVNSYKNVSKRCRPQIELKETNQTGAVKFAPTKQDLKQDNFISKGMEKTINKLSESQISTSSHIIDSSSRRNSKSRIPVSTRTKKLQRENPPNDDKIIKPQKETVDKSTHDYINTPSKIPTNSSNVRKLKAPAVLPKPKKRDHERAAHFGFSETSIDSRTRENIVYNGKIP